MINKYFPIRRVVKYSVVNTLAHIVYVTTSSIKKKIQKCRGSRSSLIVDAGSSFHYKHLEPVLKLLAKHADIDLVCVKWDGFDEVEFENVRYIEMPELTFIEKLKANAVLTACFHTKRHRICQRIGTSLIYLCHGVGPKVVYLRNIQLNMFTHLLSTGPQGETYQRQAIFSPTKILSTGMPMTDNLFNHQVEEKRDLFKLDPDKKTILYAPTYHGSFKLVDEWILNNLKSIKRFNVIVRPHPLFFIRNNDETGRPWSEVFDDLQKHEHIFLHYGDGTTVNDVLPFVDALIVDLSSVLFEALAYNIPLMQYMDNSFYEEVECKDCIDIISDACYQVNKKQVLESQIEHVLSSDKKSESREKLKNHFFYNQGNATQVAVNHIMKILF
ncbi:MAG: hypothetical protein GY793_00035 [Proteobacteria bacterium]|nr:hypothetical protein [Pseudomonadota bacterium]